VLGRICGLERGEMVGGWSKLHNEELHNLYSSPHIIKIIKSRRMRRDGHVAPMGKNRNAYRVLVGKAGGKRPLGRHRWRWKDNIKIDVIEICWDGVDCIHLAQKRGKWRGLVNTAMNVRAL
jgi:hypothetical protein